MHETDICTSPVKKKAHPAAVTRHTRHKQAPFAEDFVVHPTTFNAVKLFYAQYVFENLLCSYVKSYFN